MLAPLISLRTAESAEVFVKTDTIARMSFSKDASLSGSERKVNIVFTDGTTGTYIAHRNLVNKLYAVANSASSELAE